MPFSRMLSAMSFAVEQRASASPSSQPAPSSPASSTQALPSPPLQLSHSIWSFVGQGISGTPPRSSSPFSFFPWSQPESRESLGYGQFPSYLPLSPVYSQTFWRAVTAAFSSSPP